MKPVSPKDTPGVGGGITGPWSDPPGMIPLPAPPINPFPIPIIGDPIVPLINDPNNPSPDLT